MQDSFGRTFKHLFSKKFFLLWLGLALLLSVAGPFGSYKAGAWGMLFLYWFTVVIAGVAVGGIARILAHHLIPSGKRPWGDLLSFAIVVLLLTPLVWVLTTQVFWPEETDLPSFARLTGYVVTVAALVSLIRRTLPLVGEMKQSGLSKAKPDEPMLYRRLPEGFEGPVLRLTVQDHMVNVVTPQDTHSIRMRFSDAVAEMGAVTGYCTHRSHWVARKAIERVQRNDGRLRLVLTNGDVIPVSRKYKPELEAAGLV
jgi:hypothetical protein